MATAVPTSHWTTSSRQTSFPPDVLIPQDLIPLKRFLQDLCTLSPWLQPPRSQHLNTVTHSLATSSHLRTLGGRCLSSLFTTMEFFLGTMVRCLGSICRVNEGNPIGIHRGLHSIIFPIQNLWNVPSISFILMWKWLPGKSRLDFHMGKPLKPAPESQREVLTLSRVWWPSWPPNLGNHNRSVCL